MEDNKVVDKQSSEKVAVRPNATEMEMLYKAISLLQNHVPQYGDVPYASNEDYQSAPEDKMDKVPLEIKREMDLALIAAARFVKNAFNSTTKDAPVV